MPETPTVATAVVISGAARATGQMLSTPAGFADIPITVIGPLLAILIRAAKAYVQTLVGLLAAGGLGLATETLPAGDFMHTLKVCAGLSVASSVMSLLTNVSVLLTALGDRFPILKT